MTDKAEATVPSSFGFLGTQTPHPLLLSSEEPMGHHADAGIRWSGCTCPGVASYPSPAGLSQCCLYLGPASTVGVVPDPMHTAQIMGEGSQGSPGAEGGLLISSPLVGLSPTPSPTPHNPVPFPAVRMFLGKFINDINIFIFPTSPSPPQRTR